MMSLLLASALLGVALGSSIYTAPNHPDWLAFKKDHGKAYSSLAEEHYRFEIFMQTKALLDQHNQEFAQGLHSYDVAINHLADLTPAEHQQLRGYLAPPPEDVAKLRAKGSPHKTVGTPSSMDWRSKGAVTPVQNQGQCGSCYTFAAAAALEGHEFLKTGRLVKLSESNLVDCSGKYGNYGCRGGWPSACYQYIKDNRGIDTEQYYPYHAYQGSCRYNRAGYGGIDEGYYSIQKSSESALQDVVGNHGPAAVAIDARDYGFSYYRSGVYKSNNCGNGDYDLDHAVTAVGYGNENGQDYWLVKNSWGTGWGDNGYIKMARNHNNMCGIATAAVWPKV